MYDKRDDFDFDIVDFPFLDGDVPSCASYGVYISQPFRYAIVRNHDKKVQVGNDQEKAQSENDSNSKNRGGKKPN